MHWKPRTEAVLHRDIKPANVLVSDYGEPQLSDFGIAHIEGGYETATGFFSGTIDYTAPEVMTGKPATVASDLYSLGATIYALMAGGAAHERKNDEDLVAQYLRISTTRIPDMRPEGIPEAVCAAVEHAMAIDPAERPVSAAEFGRELQSAQRLNGLRPDSMAITSTGPESGSTLNKQPNVAESSVVPAEVVVPAPDRTTSTVPGSTPPAADPGSATRPVSDVIGGASPRLQPGPPDPDEFSEAANILRGAYSAETQVHVGASAPSGQPASSGSVPPSWRKPFLVKMREWFADPGNKRNRVAMVGGAAVLVVLLVVGGLYFGLKPDNNQKPVASPPPTQAPVVWKPITNDRVSRVAAATTQVDGTIWVFGGIRSDGTVTALQEGYDPVIDSWKGRETPLCSVVGRNVFTANGLPAVDRHRVLHGNG